MIFQQAIFQCLIGIMLIVHISAISAMERKFKQKHSMAVRNEGKHSLDTEFSLKIPGASYYFAFPAETIFYSSDGDIVFKLGKLGERDIEFDRNAGKPKAFHYQITKDQQAIIFFDKNKHRLEICSYKPEQNLFYAYGCNGMVQGGFTRPDWYFFSVQQGLDFRSVGATAPLEDFYLDVRDAQPLEIDS